MPKLNANDDNTWSVTASSEEEALSFIVGLDNCLAHPELDTVEKIQAWLSEQEDEQDDDES